MQIAEIMKLIPDDGELSFRNNSGVVIIGYQQYNFLIEEMVKSEMLSNDLFLSVKIPEMVLKVLHKTLKNANS